MSYAPSRAIVDLDAYAHNLNVVRGLIPRDCLVMAVMKANAYGHGLIPIARKAVEAGASMLGVATVEEGAEIRREGIETPIAVLVQPTPDYVGGLVEYDLHAFISDVSIARRLGETAAKANKIASVHCKVDTGMGRQGFNLDHVAEQIRHIKHISPIDIAGISTHFASGELTRDPYSATQVRAFKRLITQMNKDGIPYGIAHAANSAAIINVANSAFDMVRAGIMTYGVWPTDNPQSKTQLRPVLRWETRVVIVRELEKGASVGYARTYVTPHKTRTAVIPVGYADGYKFQLSNRGEVLIRGSRCPIVGRISMDQMMVDVTHLVEVHPGDRVTLIGTDGSETITAEELADQTGTIAWDILASIGPRVERLYQE